MLNLNTFLVKERVTVMKLVDTYDIFDPDSGNQVGIAREEPSAWAKWLRLVLSKQLMPTTINIYEREGEPPLFSIHRPFSLGRPKVQVRDASGSPVGYFKSKLQTLGVGFWVYDNQDNQVAEVKGDWKGWNFKFLSSTQAEMGLVTKKWVGVAKELFTSADNYIVSIDPMAAAQPTTRMLLLAAALAIDIVYKEQ